MTETDKLKQLYTSTITKLTENLANEKKRNDELNGRIKELEEIIEDTKRSNSSVSAIRTSEKEKKVAELYASGLASGFIYKVMLEQLNMDLSINDIDKIISNLKGDGRGISIDLIDHYNNAKKIFAEKNVIDKQYFVSSMRKKFELLEDEYTTSLMIAKNEGNEDAKRKILDALTKLYQVEATSFSKNNLAVFGKQASESQTKDYDDQVAQLFGDDSSDNKTVIKFKKVQ